MGGTKARAALVNDRGELGRRVERPTHGEFDPRLLVGLLGELLDESPERPEAVGVAFAGFIDSSGRIAFAPNLDVADGEVAGPLEERFNLPAVVVNDANAAAWGEYRSGSGRGAQHLLMLTVGTGIGGGIVLDGRLYTGSRGFAAEFGHIPVQRNGPRCACGARGCLEAMASGTALARMAREEIGDHPESSISELAGGERRNITGAMVGQAAAGGDEFALDLLDRLGVWLGVGIAGLAQAFDPDLVVVGGGVAKSGSLFLSSAIKELSDRFAGQVDPPPVVPAALGNDAGVIGSALVALDHGSRRS